MSLKTYQILLDLNVEDPEDTVTIKEAIYSYLEELIEDDSLIYEEKEKMKGKKYIIEHNFSYGWDILNEFVHDDCYDTQREAQEAIDDLIDTTKQAFKDGDISEPYNPADYRVKEIQI
jgi:hypothetical protein